MKSMQMYFAYTQGLQVSDGSQMIGFDSPIGVTL
jgi:hypothetical protein